METPPAKERDVTQVGNLLEQKFTLSAQIKSIQAEIAAINTNLVKEGATTEELACL